MFVKLRVYPSSKRDVLRRRGDDAYDIWTKAPAERGLANAAALRVLASELNTDVRKIMLVKGARSPAKIVKILI